MGLRLQQLIACDARLRVWELMLMLMMMLRLMWLPLERARAVSVEACGVEGAPHQCGHSAFAPPVSPKLCPPLRQTPAHNPLVAPHSVWGCEHVSGV